MNWQPSASLAVIRQRALVYRQIRAFFEARDCLEVDTPSLMATTNSDIHIDAISVAVNGRLGYLQSSPEFAMKRLLAAGIGSIYQLGHAFRDGESGRHHHPEFALLEWYRIGFDYHQLMDEIELLISTLAPTECQFKRLSYHQLFEQQLTIDIDQTSLADLQQICVNLIPDFDSSRLETDQCLDLLLSLVIEPKMRGYCFVYDYPLSQASLARANRNGSETAERFELFYNGLELANGFSELTDASEQRRRFLRDNETRRARNLVELPTDERLLAALTAGCPECAGVAIGLDRLLMVLLQLDSIEKVLSFAQG